MARSLRDYQIEAVEAVRNDWANGITRTAIVLATGLGKTDCIAKLATDHVRDGGKVLALAHRDNLLDQIAERCRMHDPGVSIGRVAAERNQRGRDITVAMAPTLARESRRSQLPQPSLVIVDECHHAAARSYMDILAWAGSFDRTPTLGATATLVRGRDKRGSARLGDVWQSCAFDRDTVWAIRHGWLVTPRGKAVVLDHLDLDAAKVSRGDYTDDELGEMIAQDTDQIVKAWQEHASERLTVAFTPNVASAEQLAAEFTLAGVSAGLVVGTTPERERNRIYADLEAGIIRVLVNVMVATEGWDCPPVSCVLMARPTRLPGLYAQIVGRGLRLAPGKDDCLVLDVVGVSRRQKLCRLVDLVPSAEQDDSQLGEELAPKLEASEQNEDQDIEPWQPQVVGYEDVSLFAESRLAWLFTRGGIRFLPARDRLVVLWPDDGPGAVSETFSVGHCATRSAQGQWLAERLPLQEAFDVAEAWAIDYDASLVGRDARWRKRRNHSERQLEYARRCGVRSPERLTVGQVSDGISIALASRRLDVIR
jgi:superfamily II DNA or RNA helicase